MIYIASPYSHPDVNQQHFRYEAVRARVRDLVTQGFVAFSPIVYAHELARNYKMKTDAATWEHFNTSIIRRCDRMEVYMLPGWDKSLGVTAEIALAKQLYIPLSYVMPEPDEDY